MQQGPQYGPGQQAPFVFNQESVFNLIANNPQGRQFVESLARMNQIGQTMQQFGPQIQQFAQNPMQAMSNLGQMAQGQVNQWNQQAQQQQQMQPPTDQPSPQQPVVGSVIPAQGGPPMAQGGFNLGMAMDLVTEFKATLTRMEEQQKEMSDKVNDIFEKMAALQTQNKTISTDLSAVRRSVGKPEG